MLKVDYDLDAGTIEFFVNGNSQGIVFQDVRGPVRPAVSLTSTGAQVVLRNFQ